MWLKTESGRGIVSIAGVLMKARTVLNQLRANLSVPVLLSVKRKKTPITREQESGKLSIHIVKS